MHHESATTCPHDELIVNNDGIRVCSICGIVSNDLTLVIGADYTSSARLDSVLTGQMVQHVRDLLHGLAVSGFEPNCLEFVSFCFSRDVGRIQAMKAPVGIACWCYAVTMLFLLRSHRLIVSPSMAHSTMASPHFARSTLHRTLHRVGYHAAVLDLIAGRVGVEGRVDQILAMAEAVPSWITTLKVSPGRCLLGAIAAVCPGSTVPDTVIARVDDGPPPTVDLPALATRIIRRARVINGPDFDVTHVTPGSTQTQPPAARPPPDPTPPSVAPWRVDRPRSFDVLWNNLRLVPTDSDLTLHSWVPTCSHDRRRARQFDAVRAGQLSGTIEDGFGLVGRARRFGVDDDEIRRLTDGDLMAAMVAK